MGYWEAVKVACHRATYVHGGRAQVIVSFPHVEGDAFHVFRVDNIDTSPGARRLYRVHMWVEA